MNTQHMMMNWTVADAVAPQDNKQQVKAAGVTIAELIERNAAFDQWKRDVEVNANDFVLQPEGYFTMAGEGRYTIEDHALAQMCARIGNAHMGFAIPTNYAKFQINNEPALFSPILAKSASAYGKEVLLRSYNGSVRAFMSDKYTHIDNRDVLPMLEKFINDKAGGQYELVRPYVGRDEMNVRIMFRDVSPEGGKDGNYGIGVVVRTGEIGNVSPAVLPFIQRHACENSTVWQEGGTVIKQAGNRDYKLMQLLGAIGSALGGSAELLEKMMATRYVELPSIDSIITGLAAKFDWGSEMTYAVSAGTENSRTLFGLVNGLTYAAHAVNMPAQQALEMEMLGGKMATSTASFAKSFAKN